MSRIRIQTVSFNLGSSPSHNVLETTRMVQEAADQGWTMRGCYGHQGVLYLIFASKTKGEAKPLRGAPELAKKVDRRFKDSGQRQICPRCQQYLDDVGTCRACQYPADVVDD